MSDEKRPPDWLPDLLNITGYDTRLLDWLHDLLKEDFGPPSRCSFRDRPVWLDTRTIGSEYPEGLWHLVTREDKPAKLRLVDFERARHLLWCAAVIHNYEASEVTCWHFLDEQKQEIRARLWLRDWNYVVVLTIKKRPRGIVYGLVTAYLVDKGWKERQLAESYKKRLDESVEGWDEVPKKKTGP